MKKYASSITDNTIREDILVDIDRFGNLLLRLDEKYLPKYIDIIKAFCPTQPGRHPSGKSFSLTDPALKFDIKHQNATIRAVSKALQHITPRGINQEVFIVQSRNICNTNPSEETYVPCQKESKKEGQAKAGLVNIFGEILRALGIPACVTSMMGTSTKPHYFFGSINKELFGSVLSKVYHPSIWVLYNCVFKSFEGQALRLSENGGTIADHYGEFFKSINISHSSDQIWQGFSKDKGLVFFSNCTPDDMNDLTNVIKKSLSKREKKEIKTASPRAFMSFTHEQRVAWLAGCSKGEGWIGSGSGTTIGALATLAYALNKKEVNWDVEKLPTTLKMLFGLMKEHKLYKSKPTKAFIKENLRPLVKEKSYFVNMGSVGGSSKSEAKTSHSRSVKRLGGDDSAFKSDLQTALRKALNGITITEYNDKNLKKLVKAIKPAISKLVTDHAPTSTTVRSIKWVGGTGSTVWKDADKNMKMQLKAPDFWKSGKGVVLNGHENADNSNVKRRVQAEMQVIIYVLQELETVEGGVSTEKAQFLKNLLHTIYLAM